ncbi:MAG: hypothetical protein K4571_13695 [Deltaproteobacteria bacterium]
MSASENMKNDLSLPQTGCAGESGRAGAHFLSTFALKIKKKQSAGTAGCAFDAL